MDNKLSPGKPPQPEQSRSELDLPSLDEATQDQLIEALLKPYGATLPGGLSNVSLSDGDEYDARLDQGIIIGKIHQLTIREFIELLNKIKKTSFEDGRLSLEDDANQSRLNHFTIDLKKLERQLKRQSEDLNRQLLIFYH